MYDPLGLSIGTMNLVAAVNGSSPVIRRAVLTLYPHCAPKLGVFGENSADPGTLMSAFVERIGDSVALISPDGSAHDPDLLTVEALDAMVVAVGADASSAEITIAVPAHWKPATVQALRNALRTHVGFVRSGMAPCLVPDAIAALTAVNAEVGVPTGGVVGLLDFGGSGTYVTLLETKDEFEPVSATMRYDDFSGNQIDQAVLLHVIEELGHSDVDPAGPAVLGQLGRLSEQCREAKERLSTDAVTELAAELNGASASIELTREKFEDLIADRLTGLIYAFDDMLARNNSSFADLAAVVTVGGGANIPLVRQRLSFHTRLPVLAASDPVSAAAKGALLMATRRDLMDLRTRTSIGLLAGVSQAAGAAGSGVIDLPAGDVMVIDQDALTDRELAWSQTEFPEVPTRFQGDSYNEDGPCFSMRLNIIDPPKAPRRRIRLSQLLIGLCAAVAMTAVGGVAITLTAVEQRHTHRPAPVLPSVAPPPVSPNPKLPSPIPTSPAAPSPLPPPPPPSEAMAPSAAA
ncbi:Hsp70 family protein, partial [Mycobacterium gordonae]|uniref:Hsp70 family protein n=1 Tax=Mycobacterium gordonae TaxID=1778 RepID=UPI00210A2A0F